MLCFSKCLDMNAVISDFSLNKDCVQYVRMTFTHKKNLLASDFVSGSQYNPDLTKTPKTVKFQVNIGQISSLPVFSEGTCDFTLDCTKLCDCFSKGPTKKQRKHIPVSRVLF